MHYTPAQLIALVALAIPATALPLGPSASLLLPGARGSAFEIFKREPAEDSKPHQSPKSESDDAEEPEIFKREPAEQKYPLPI
ncbi:hypothetical protein GGTG_08888 [Gaeumannomyces tritici R3-111a-1]|uniref:Uncharacterized protein n=1 Tax=Gaeumannomyces tritici (strain R3-111a-1) TaxID=644352 RepID=J3P5U8_GAET3|nr:hypothetical protein GGTG_08888 [Gaeumannomyces tritici R3-111a-1]EJT75050.1 hypothetical protein GGTG_08888 [Gaeumannomyces tritici R3-111a-1]